jgi:acetyl-CoA carboxylase biotin carboxyl carrier protein
MTSFQRPRAVQGEPQGLGETLAAVQRTAAELLAAAPVPPSTLTVRAGDVSVEMGWTPGEAGAVPAPVTPITQAAAPAAETLDAATVGVFYRAPAPGAPPFVAEGDEVCAGQQVAIIEAMKLMLPVEAARAGRIAEVLVADGEAVEYGQPLFRLADEALGQAA